MRLSGDRTKEIAEIVLGDVPRPRYATLAQFKAASGESLDTGIALFFPGPRSYTGEDVLEFQGHGGRVVQNLLIERLLKLDVRLARGGEFTERAFLNGRLDLAQAEAVADLIASASSAGAYAAMRSLTGEFSVGVKALDAEILQLRVALESAIDFTDEDIEFVDQRAAAQALAHISARLRELIRRASAGVQLLGGADIVIAGPPNAGKSKLLNALLGQDRAIVSAVPGTTRDTIDATIELSGLPVRLIDTAGFRQSADIVEREGIARTRTAIESSQGTLWLIDEQTPDNTPPEDLSANRLLVFNKCDLTGKTPGRVEKGTYRISALTGAGLDELKTAIQELVGYQDCDDAFAGRPRHVEALKRALEQIETAHQDVGNQPDEICAESLRLAQDALGEIIGQTTAEDLLGEIFSRFCIGK